ncbi:RNA polymerase sigma factor [Streptomyces chattanoogensis]
MDRTGGFRFGRRPCLSTGEFHHMADVTPPSPSSAAPPAFDEVFRGLLPRLYRRASMLAGPRRPAEEWVQAAYRTLAARPKRFLAHPDPYAHAFGAVLDAARDAHRKDRRQVPADAVEGVEETGTASLLGRLSPRQAGVVLLVDLDGYTIDQAAEIIKAPRGAAARHRSRALSMLSTLPYERLQRADEQIEVPAGLWARIKESAGGTPPVTPVVRVPRVASRRKAYAIVLAVAATVAAVMWGAWWLVRPGGAGPEPGAGVRAVPLTVYNSEAPCRRLRSLECALSLAKDPHVRYAARDNFAGRVWHGDVLAAHCVVPDGQLVRDEEGVTSARWYLVTGKRGVTGWLPGVRTRNTHEVPVCARDVA